MSLCESCLELFKKTAKEEMYRIVTIKRPVAFRVMGAAGWVFFSTEEEANQFAEFVGREVQGLYARGGDSD